MTMSPYGSQIDKPISIVDFSLLSHEKIVVALQNASYVVLNDSGHILSTAKVEKFSSRSKNLLLNLLRWLCHLIKPSVIS